MTSLQNMFFGPLNSDACLYFYFMTVFFFFLLVVALISGVLLVIKKPTQLNFKMGLHALVIFFYIFIAYFLNRLLYSMCNKSLA